MEDAALDERLAEDSYPVTELPLCQLRLMDDTRYPWLLLIPRRHGVSEVFDLDEADQQQLWRETSRIGQALKEFLGGDKLNVASLGNVVPQLHLHHVARVPGDAAWPGPVWGRPVGALHDHASAKAMIARLLGHMAAGPETAE